jgi:hypothetical protein
MDLGGRRDFGKQSSGQVSGREYSVIGVAKDAQVAHLGQLDTNYLYFPAGTEDNSRSYVLVRYATGFTDVATTFAMWGDRSTLACRSM